MELGGGFAAYASDVGVLEWGRGGVGGDERWNVG